ncbi:MAG: hypothetical protein JXK05_03935 [Campylobacterales bacterium]|nr:hypothetical protein [Campylobacterales bacterium]
MRNQLRDNIVRSLGIEADLFSLSMIEEVIATLPQEQYQPFFNALHGDEHAYLKPLDRVAKVAKLFRDAEVAALLSGTGTLAKQIYDRFYGVHTALCDFAREHGKSDLSAFFKSIDYRATKFEGEVLSRQEIYVLEKLGGGAWLCGIKREINSGVVIERIEAIIHEGIFKKHHSRLLGGEKKYLASVP